MIYRRRTGTTVKPRRKPRSKSEELEQGRLIGWIDNHVREEYRQLIFAIPNGGSRGGIVEYRKKDGKIGKFSLEAVALKKMGVRAGIADIFGSIPAKNFHGIYVEQKSATGKLSPEQKKFKDMVERLGYRYVVCRSYLEAVAALKEYFHDNSESIFKSAFT